MDAPWRIEMFGGLRAARGTEEVRRFRSQKVGALLAYLAYYAHRAHPRDTLIEMLWPECDPDAGRNRLSVSLSSLRRQLEPPGVPTGGVIVADHAGVRLNPQAVTTDVAQFESALQAASRAGSGTERRERLSEAVELYQGELLPGFFEEWVLTERERLAEAFLQAVGQWVAHLEQVGDLPRAIQGARRMVAADPLREEAHQTLIRLLAAAGQQDAALRQYRELERLLDEHLGDTPAPETHALLSSPQRPPRASGRAASGERERGDPEGLSLSHPPVGAPLVRALHTPSSELLSEPFPSSAVSPPSGTVTFLLTDIEGSTALWERVGEAFPVALASHHGLLRPLFAQHHGYEVKEMGDAFLVAFSRAGDALACAVAAQRALAAHPWPATEGHSQGVPLRVRMALHTGDVAPEGGDYHGLVLHHAQRVLVAGHGGQILCSEATATLLRRDLAAEVKLADLGVYRLRDVTVPERLFQVEYPGRERETFPPLKAEPGYASNLPLQFTRFFGREGEIELLGKLLGTRETRLVTLMGSGGSGKTRLALEVARQAGEAWHGATWFVPLADLAEAQRLGEAVRDALRLPRSPGEEPLEQVVTALTRQPSLLLLDNCEHLVTQAAHVVQLLLERVPTLTILTTSRQRLDVPGEREFLVPPLPVPSLVEPSAEADLPERAPAAVRLSRCTSVQLFMDRAQAVRPDFQVTASNAAALADLCCRLEGIPLALELAAARVGVLTPAQILARLSQRFDLLARRGREPGARHASLRAAIDWSYQLLSPDLQRFFPLLSVFRGGFTLEAAEAVCETAAALDALTELRECSLVLAEESGDEMRYGLLETLREYGAEQLTPEERTVLAHRHRDYFLQLGEQAEEELTGEAQGEWLERLETERENLRAALACCADRGEAEPGLRLSGALARFWAVRGYLREGREHLTRLLALPGAEVCREARAKALNGAGILARLQSDYRAARAFFEESLRIRRELGDRGGAASMLNNVGLAAMDLGDYEAARALYEESLTLSRELNNRRSIANALGNLGIVVYNQSDYRAAREFFEESLAIKRELGDLQGIANTLMNLGNATMNLGEYPAARAVHEESLRIKRELGDRWGIAYSLQNLGCAAMDEGDNEAARLFHEESLAIRRELGDQRGIADCLANLGSLARRQRDDGTARALHEESVAIYRELGDQRGLAGALCGLGTVALHQGDPDAARSLYEESLSLRQELGEQQGILECLEELAQMWGRQGQAVRAMRLLGTAESLRDALRVPRPPGERAEYEQRVASVRTSLTDEAVASAWAEGQAMTLQQAIDCALETSGPV